eukprot:Phypoly_transcript_03911.p1 GENE.Phypoly_transcript_03911~~Phypoly_transcript_03911.p1  ORF type:complete len:663 (+),score=153.91 Phypoly_transcript_03911:91-2079(+)
MASHQPCPQVDPNFEFEAPKYIDFDTGVENEAADVWFDTNKSSIEELKTTDLLESNSNEDFGTSSNIQINKKRPENSPKDHRPAKKHRAQYNPVQSFPLTVPESPCFATNSRLRGSVFESEEDMQCRYMASMLVEQAKRRRQQSFYKKKALYMSTGYLPTRSTKPLTEPEEVHFHTDHRLRGVPVEEDHKHEPVIEKTEQGLTIPRPFQLHTDMRVRPDFDEPPKTSPYKSFKQKMIEIQKKTPKRFRTLPRNKLWQQQRSPQAPFKLEVTIPKEFSFETMERSRPIHALSAEEREELEMLNMPKFKALPLDQKVLNSGGQFGLQRLPKVPLTEPMTPKFETDERARVARREVHTEEEEQIQMFRARELDRTIFAGPPKGVPALPHKEVTIPESPFLATKSRSIFHPPPAVPKEEQFVFKARPIPIVEPFVPERPGHHTVEVQPFQLQTEVRGQQATKKMSDKVKKMKLREKKQRAFKAQPMPIPDRPEPQGFAFAPPVTLPQPFYLLSEARGEQHAQKFQQQVQEEEKEKKEMALFKAHPIPIVTPFEPKKTDKPLTIISDFELNSDVRSQQRRKFEMQKNEKAKLAEETRKQQEEERRIEEEKFIKQMRKKLVHKPQPILPSNPIKIHGSTTPLTDPHTPLLRTRQRSAANSHSHTGRDF